MRYYFLLIVFLLIACGGSSELNSSADRSFLNYALMNKNSSGQVVDNHGNTMVIWHRQILDKNSSVITWDTNEEIFYWDNTWVYLDRYRDSISRTEYDQYVTKQEFCQSGVCTIISTGGKQKYAPLFPQDSYTLDTVGYIIDSAQNKRIEFRHYQSVVVGVACSNPYYKNQLCLTQNEQWWDNNQTLYSLKLDRKTWYALGLGIAFIIDNKMPTPYTAYLK